MTGASESGNEPSQRAEGQARRYIESGLAVVGLDAGADEIAVIEAVDAIYSPSLQALLAEGFDGIPHEPGADLSRAPRTEAER